MIRDQLSTLFRRLHVLVIGPGLGRETYMLDFARLALDIAKEQGMFIVLDADGLSIAGQKLKGYRRAVLTPNVVEFKRLSEQVVCVASYSPFERDTLIPVIRVSIPIRHPRNEHRRYQERWVE